MKHFLTSTILVLLLACCEDKPLSSSKPKHPTPTKMTKSSENQAIEKLLFSYRDALNTSDVAKAVSMYTSAGVFMPTNGPTAIGTEQLSASYAHVFQNIQLNIEFFVDEIIISGNYAFARTMSKGTTLIHASGQTIPEENRELFVFEKVGTDWKIARYMFNKTK